MIIAMAPWTADDTIVLLVLLSILFAASAGAVFIWAMLRGGRRK